MMIEYSIFARSDADFSNQNAYFLATMLAKFLLDQDDRANKFCPIMSYVFLLDRMIGDRPYR